MALVVVLLLALVIVSKKVAAQPAQPRLAAPAARDAWAPPAKPDPRAPTGPRADAGVPAPVASPVETALGGDGGADPIDYAVLQTDEDFPKDMSDAEKIAIGTGKVPIHREGAYRSPFAHPRFGGPTKVKVGLVIRQIRAFDVQTGGFEADFFLSLTGDKALPPLNPVFTNGHEVTLTPLADTETFKVFSVTGKFTTEIDLRRYPFDEQALEIALEDQRAGVDQLLFDPDPNRTSLDSSFKLASFGVAGIAAQAYEHKYPPRFDRDDLYVSRYKFILTVDRFATSAAFSVYVPALIIVLISLTGLWVPPEELEVRAASGAPMLAAAVLFHYSLIQALPATGYLTSADKLMLGVYVALLLNMGSTWMLMLGEDRWRDKVFRVARTAVPVLTFVVMTLAIVV